VKLIFKRILKTAGNAFIAARPWSFAMSLISVSIGTLLAVEDGPIHWGWFALTCVGIVFFHAAANILNDYFDTLNGVDQPDSPTALYRRQPILSGLFSPRQTLFQGVLLCILTVLIGLTLAFERSVLVLWIGLAGLLACIFYTAGPVKLKYRAWGEVFVFLMWGPLMFEGAYAVQRGTLSVKTLLVSIPFGMLVALVILANNIRDINYDSRRKIKTVSIFLGPVKSIRLYTGLIAASYLSIIAMVLMGTLSPWTLLVFLSSPKAVGLVRAFAARVPDAADALTAQLNTIFGILLIAGFIADKLVPM